jgi:hypothetical protein
MGSFWVAVDPEDDRAIAGGFDVTAHPIPGVDRDDPFVGCGALIQVRAPELALSHRLSCVAHSTFSDRDAVRRHARRQVAGSSMSACLVGSPFEVGDLGVVSLSATRLAAGVDFAIQVVGRVSPHRRHDE